MVHGSTSFVEIKSKERDDVQANVLNSVKVCQTKFGGRTELATELDHHISMLCAHLEEALSHGLKEKTVLKKSSAIKQVTDLVLRSGQYWTFWDPIKDILSYHERERFELLKQVWTDRGRGRAWLRASLNEHTLERYLNSLVTLSKLSTYYEEWSFIRNQETCSVFLNVAAGLGTILFAISIDKPELNNVRNSSLSSFQGSAVGYDEQVIESPVPIQTIVESRNILESIISFGPDNIGSITPNSSCDNVNITVSSPSLETVSENAEENSLYANVECAEEAAGALGDLDLNLSDTEHLTDHEVSLTSTSIGLRPINNSSIGELIPISQVEETHSSEDSISVPSFSEDIDTVNRSIKVDDDNVELLYVELVKLKERLEDANEMNQSLKTNMSDVVQQNLQKVQQAESKIQELNRENELLKHQLRKYVSAVQMLKHEGGYNEENSNIYEQKLIQVAEMFGELMELNDRLQRTLVSKENIIRRLYMELEALRGPLGPTEIDIHTQIISLWVPSVFLSGPPKPHHVYQIHIRLPSDEWNVFRRYNQFYELHQTVKKQHPIISAFQFPPKKTLGNKETKFVEERRLKLQQYLRRLLNHIVANNPPLSASPNKVLLTTILPFFGDKNESSNQQPQTRTGIQRLPHPSTPQYAGL